MSSFRVIMTTENIEEITALREQVLQLQAEVKVMSDVLFKATNEVWWAKNASNDLCDMVTNVLSTQPSTTLADI